MQFIPPGTTGLPRGYVAYACNTRTAAKSVVLMGLPQPTCYVFKTQSLCYARWMNIAGECMNLNLGSQGFEKAMQLLALNKGRAHKHCRGLACNENVVGH